MGEVFNVRAEEFIGSGVKTVVDPSLLLTRVSVGPQSERPVQARVRERGEQIRGVLSCFRQ